MSLLAPDQVCGSGVCAGAHECTPLPRHAYVESCPFATRQTEIAVGSVILDICSTWVSHYPDDFPQTMKRISGTGINTHELRLNRQLSDFAHRDLNVQPQLPYADGLFDVVTCVVSISYLIHPIAVYREVRRVLRPGGKFIVSISNQCFPTKAVRMWLNMDAHQHCLVVAAYFHYALGWADAFVYDISPLLPEKPYGRPRPARDSVHIIQATTAALPRRRRGLSTRARPWHNHTPGGRCQPHQLGANDTTAVTSVATTLSRPPVYHHTVDPALARRPSCTTATTAPTSLAAPPLSVVVAMCAKTRGIGVEGALPWALCADMKYFRTLTLGTIDNCKRNAVVMGRHTWTSIPERFRPLAGRLNVVLSRSANARAAYRIPDGVLVVSSLEAALRQLASAEMAAVGGIERSFVIGGAAVYADALARPELDRVHVTEVTGAGFILCDAFFPPLEPQAWQLVSNSRTYQEGNVSFQFLVYERAAASTVVNGGWNGWLRRWRRALDSWLLVMPADAAVLLHNCVAFFGGVLSSRFDMWILLRRLELDAAAVAAPPPPQLHLPSESCEMLVEQLEHTLPEFPTEPSDFNWMLPPLFREQFNLVSVSAVTRRALLPHGSPSTAKASPSAESNLRCSLHSMASLAYGFASGTVVAFTALRLFSATGTSHTHVK